MNCTSIHEEFLELDLRKRENPGGISMEEMERLRDMRCEIERALFQSSPQPGADRREHLRAPVSLLVRYWTDEEMRDRYVSVLGEGGLFIHTEKPLKTGRRIEMEIVLVKEGTTVNVGGEVAWVSRGDEPAKRGMGIKFAGLTYEQKTLIYNWVRDSLRERLLERRRFSRIDSQLPAEFLYSEGSFQLNTEDLGAGGVFIATDHLVMERERIKIKFRVPGSRIPLLAVARVVRAVEEPAPGLSAGLGLGFVMLDKNGRKIVLDYMIDRVMGCVVTDGEASGSRRHPRIKRRIPARLRFGEDVGACFCLDLSYGGAFVQAHNPPPKGSDITLDLYRSMGGEVLSLPGRVVRLVSPDPVFPNLMPGAGVSFTDEDGKKGSMVKEMMKDHILLDAAAASIHVGSSAHGCLTDLGVATRDALAGVLCS